MTIPAHLLPHRIDLYRHAITLDADTRQQLHGYGSSALVSSVPCRIYRDQQRSDGTYVVLLNANATGSNDPRVEDELRNLVDANGTAAVPVDENGQAARLRVAEEPLFRRGPDGTVHHLSLMGVELVRSE